MLLRFNSISASALLCLVAASTHAQVPSTVSTSLQSLAAINVASVETDNSNTNAFPVTVNSITPWDIEALGDDECLCMDLVFMVDITGSMDSTLSNLKNQDYGLPGIIDLAEIRSGDTSQNDALRIGLVTFCDDEEKVTVNHALTDNISAVRTAIANLVSGSGGDTPEPSDEALREVLRPFGCLDCGSPCLDTVTMFDQAFRSQCVKHAVLITDALPGGCEGDNGDHEAAANRWADEAAAAGLTVSAMYAVDNPETVAARIMHYYADTTFGLYAVVGADVRDIGVELSEFISYCPDCNDNGVLDAHDIAGSTSDDCNLDGIPDECQPNEDCNDNGQKDLCEIGADPSLDCNLNLRLDSCELDNEEAEDCNYNGTIDVCDIYDGFSEDCNANWIPDECEPIIYVDYSATGGLNDGTSWTDAFIDLQDALDETCGMREIWVAQGTYIPTVAIDGGDARTKTFDISSGPLLYGGFYGDETSRDQRNPDLYETILSGDLDQDDVGDFTNNGQNAYHVVYFKRQSEGIPDAVLDGFTVCRGNADIYADRWTGGGLYADAAWASYGRPIIRNCRFHTNSAEMAGGALFWDVDGGWQISNCLFMNNRLDGWEFYGTALATDRNLTVTNCTFVDNDASDSGISCGAIGANYDDIVITVTNCILWGNVDSSGSDYESQVFAGNGSAIVNYSCIQNWTTGGTGNTASDPLLLDTVGPVYNLRLGSGSPCIDSGDNTAVPVDVDTDIASQARFVDDPGTTDSGNGTAPFVDMGAYEYADCNDNGVSDSVDIAGDTSEDCNGNLVPDECDIASGYSSDANVNSIPDECESPFFVSILSMADHDGIAGDLGITIDPTDGASNVEPREQVVAGQSLPYVRVEFSKEMSIAALGVTVTPCGSGGLGGATATATIDPVDSRVVNIVFDQAVADETCYLFDLSGLEASDGTVFGDSGQDTDFCLCYLEADINASGLVDGGDSNRVVSPSNWLMGADEAADGPGVDINRSGVIDGGDNNKVVNPSNWGSTTGNVCPASTDGDCNENGVSDFCDISMETSVDCNLNSIPDECDIASSTSFDVNLNSIPDECDAPIITAAVSRKTHGAVGDFDVDLLVGDTECRAASVDDVTTFVITFDIDVAATDGTLDTGDVSISDAGATVDSVSINDNVLTVVMSDVADKQCLAVTLDGISSIYGVPLADDTVSGVIRFADQTNDGASDASDIVAAKGASNPLPITSANFRSDINLDGLANAGDIVLTKGASYPGTTTCP